MARLDKPSLLRRVIAAFEEGGFVVLVEQATHPFILRVGKDGLFLRTRIYIWNITHGGGRARAADEYRIQVTGVAAFSVGQVDRTLVLGWWEQGGVFAAWDVTKHLARLGASPSLQVLEGCLESAVRDRLATQRKGNDEIVVSFLPSFLGDYLVQQAGIHALAESPRDLVVLESVIADPTQSDVAVAAATSEPRGRVLRQVARSLRDGSFAARVLRAYGSACAMCGVQLRLIDAAHIIPVAMANNDLTSNGIALCAIHHRAFDRALVTMDEKYRVVLNPDGIKVLQNENLAAGLGAFRKNLRALLALPPAAPDRPDPAFISRGNRDRGWRRFERVA